MAVHYYHDQNQRPLIYLNFDINGTIVSLDSAEKTSSEGRISVELAKAFVNKWDAHSDPMSFEQYVDTVLYPADKEAAKNAKEKFVEWVKETNHPVKEEVARQYEEITQVFTDPKTGEVNLDQVYPSFVYALDRPKVQDADYRICLRTFGFDLEKVVQQIHNSDWAKRLDIRFENRGTFDGKNESDKNSLVFNGERIEDIRKIFDVLVSSKGHSAIQDSFSRWNSNQKQARFGKPFLFAKDNFFKDRQVICMMFDDFGHRIVSPVEVATGKEIKPQDTPYVVVVNTIEAIVQKDYFWKKILGNISQVNPGYAAKLEAGESFPEDDNKANYLKPTGPGVQDNEERARLLTADHADAKPKKKSSCLRKFCRIL